MYMLHLFSVFFHSFLSLCLPHSHTHHLSLRANAALNLMISIYKLHFLLWVSFNGRCLWGGKQKNACALRGAFTLTTNLFFPFRMSTLNRLFICPSAFFRQFCRICFSENSYRSLFPMSFSCISICWVTISLSLSLSLSRTWSRGGTNITLC